MEESSAWEANLSCKQQSHYGEEDGEDKEDVRGAHHRVVGQLVWLTSDLVDVEAYWEDERCHAEQDHCKEEKKIYIKLNTVKQELLFITIYKQTGPFFPSSQSLELCYTSSVWRKGTLNS